MSSYECKKLKFPGNFDHLNLSIMTFSFMLYLRISVWNYTIEYYYIKVYNTDQEYP